MKTCLGFGSGQRRVTPCGSSWLRGPARQAAGIERNDLGQTATLQVENLLFRLVAGSQRRASTSVTLPSKSVVSTWVELSGTTVFITPMPSLCSHLIAPVLASMAKSNPFLVP